MAYTTIDNPELYFQTEIYTGNGTDGRTITLSGSEDMQPNFVWIKNRGTTDNHHLFDSVRGVNKALSTSTTNSESDAPSSGYVSGFVSDGFTVTSGSSADDNVNKNTETYVSWNWKESADAGMDLVSFTGNETARTISHSLSAVPKFMFIKNRDSGTSGWYNYHHKLGATHAVHFNATDASGSNSTIWNDTAPTSSVFTVGTNSGVNGNSNNCIAYLFSEKQGFSKFGSYTGNGNADGPFIFCGFRPALVVTKKSSDTGDWIIYDNKRDPNNLVHGRILLNSNAVEYTADSHGIDFLSNGFKIRTSDQSWNESGETFIYMAFAESPFVNSNGVPCNAR